MRKFSYISLPTENSTYHVKISNSNALCVVLLFKKSLVRYKKKYIKKWGSNYLDLLKIVCQISLKEDRQSG